MTMSERDDQLLDACLEEVLGRKTPPDLSARILTAWAARPEVEGEPVLPPAAASEPPVSLPRPAWLSAAEPEPPPVADALVHPPVAPQRRHPRRTRSAASRRSHLIWSTVAGVLVVGLGVGLLIWAWRDSGPGASPIAKQDGGQPESGSPPVENRGSPQLVGATPNQSSIARATDSSASDSRGSASADSQAESTSPASPVARASTGDVPSALGLKDFASLTDDQVVAAINAGLRQLWTDQKLEHAGPAADAEWCRRAYSRLIGRNPTVEELDQFDAARDQDKRARLVDELLGGGRYEEEFAAYWAETWARLLVGRTGGSGKDAVANREGLVNYLRQAIHKNQPFDQLTYELISATGSNRPGAEDYNGAVHFLLAHSGDKATQVTARVTRVFLGAQLQCAQCHAHPTQPQWAQNRFWQMNAFFRQMHVESDQESGITRLVNRDFRGEGKDPEGAEIYFELGDGLVRTAYPVFLDGTELPHSGRVEEVDRRTELARLVRRSPDLSRAVINRLWAHFLGYGFANPVDDIRSQNPAVLPEVWERLAGAWASKNHDLRTAMRWITRSEAFGLSSKEAGGGLADSPENGTAPRFTRYYTRPTPIEEVTRSFQLLAEARRSGKKPPAGELARRSWLSQLARRVGADSADGDAAINRRVPRSLIEMNDDVSNLALSAEQERLLDRVAKNNKMSPEQKIEHLFQAALSRKPSAQELASSKQLLEASPADLAVALRDIWWVLQNGSEFLLDH